MQNDSDGGGKMMNAKCTKVPLEQHNVAWETLPNSSEKSKTTKPKECKWDNCISVTTMKLNVLMNFNVII